MRGYRSVLSSLLSLLLFLVAGVSVLPASAGAATDHKVSVAGPPTPYLPDAVNEPALAVDANHPDVLAAGGNDLVDSSPCKGSSCDLTPDIGISGIYFSLTGGRSWVQPTYPHGLTAQSGTTHIGPIHTLPNYFENGMSSHGDPALAFGPKPGPGGFSWANGSRLYYANLAFPLTGQTPFKGSSAATVSRTDNVAAAAAGDQSAWMDPVVVSRQNAALLSDKEDIWADNASSSRFFGNVYVCNTAFRAPSGKAQPIVLSASSDGGSTWRQRQLTSAVSNAQSGGRQGCAVRTDSTGVVYVVWEGTANGQSVMYLARSFDGGSNFDKPRPIADVVDVGVFDAVSRRFVFDGFAGTRTDSFPSLSIANGAPDGAGASNTLVLTWPDARSGLNHEQALVQTSTDQGQTWSSPSNAAQAGDRPDNPAIAISPTGTDVYLVYNAYLQPFQRTTASPRNMQGVVRHADVGAGGALSAWSTLHRGMVGDARGTTRTLNREAVYDYNFAAATRTYGAAVWMDVRNAADCPAVDAYRQSLIDGNPIAAPSPVTDCPPQFGNEDIFGGVFSDPTP
ncbi:MAG TPA: sialidase family protein [Solirubrobacteraceae bacterium]|nr:sialidase family protein [Solirubrobacteraceae bacterium]